MAKRATRTATPTAERRATIAATEPSFGDTTGNEPVARGTRHLVQEEGGGLVDQDENLKETLENDGRSPQADIGLRSLETRDAGGAPTNKAAGGADETK
jgi:hypothetical protein